MWSQPIALRDRLIKNGVVESELSKSEGYYLLQYSINWKYINEDYLLTCHLWRILMKSFLLNASANLPPSAE